MTNKRRWSMLIVGPGHGLACPPGEEFRGSPAYYEPRHPRPYWHFHGLLDEDPAVRGDDMWMPLPEGPKR